METNNYMMDADNVAHELGISRGHAYKLIREMNHDLKEKGYLIIAGKIPKAYWQTRVFGYNSI
jgi:hypothetical protein